MSPNLSIKAEILKEFKKLAVAYYQVQKLSTSPRVYSSCYFLNKKNLIQLHYHITNSGCTTWGFYSLIEMD